MPWTLRARSASPPRRRARRCKCCARRRSGQGGTAKGRGRAKGQRGQGEEAHRLSPVGSAKFGPCVGAKVVARVGGLVSPTLVGAGVPVGTGVGAAHAPTRIVWCVTVTRQQPQCGRTGALLCTRYSAVEYPSSTRRASQAKSPSVRCRSPTPERPRWCRTHALHCVPRAHAQNGGAHRTVTSTARMSALGVPRKYRVSTRQYHAARTLRSGAPDCRALPANTPQSPPKQFLRSFEYSRVPCSE